LLFLTLFLIGKAAELLALMEMHETRPELEAIIRANFSDASRFPGRDHSQSCVAIDDLGSTLSTRPYRISVSVSSADIHHLDDTISRGTSIGERSAI